MNRVSGANLVAVGVMVPGVLSTRNAIENADPSKAGGVLLSLSYMEGHSVVPDRILKLMQLIMHHKVSTNAFEAVVKYDPRNWPMYRTGMHTPRSYPPTLERQKLYHHHVDRATLQLLQGVRDKLETLGYLLFTHCLPVLV